MTAWIADVLIVPGLIVMTLGVYGIVRFPTSTRSCTPRARRPFWGLHPAGCHGPGWWAVHARPRRADRRAARHQHPVAAHAIAQAAYHQREPMRAPGAVDERSTMPPPTAAPLQRHTWRTRPGS
jgi:hypothetical protein